MNDDINVNSQGCKDTLQFTDWDQLPGQVNQSLPRSFHDNPE